MFGFMNWIKLAAAIPTRKRLPPRLLEPRSTGQRPFWELPADPNPEGEAKRQPREETPEPGEVGQFKQATDEIDREFQQLRGKDSTCITLGFQEFLQRTARDPVGAACVGACF
jgi:hypothetical protein